MLPILAQMTPDTSFTVTLAVGVPLLCTLIYTTWRVANLLRDVRDELAAMRRDIQCSWTRVEHERWAFELERRNIKIPLYVPPVIEDRS